MALFAMSDLHFAQSVDKPMDVFGASWSNYTERICQCWKSNVTDNDCVIVGGDISWAMYLSEAKEDFSLINSLPGIKLLMKGNHDYWWESRAKLKKFTIDNNFSTLLFLQNDSLVYGDYSIVGTRGWILPSSDKFTSADEKIYERELIRLRLSIDCAIANEKKFGRDFEKIVVFHYPPVKSDGEIDSRIYEILKSYGIKKCIYGHLHNTNAEKSFNGISGGIEFRLVSADYLKFTPMRIDF